MGLQKPEGAVWVAVVDPDQAGMVAAVDPELLDQYRGREAVEGW